jgi:hypothetical protein
LLSRSSCTPEFINYNYHPCPSKTPPALRAQSSYINHAKKSKSSGCPGRSVAENRNIISSPLEPKRAGPSGASFGPKRVPYSSVFVRLGGGTYMSVLPVQVPGTEYSNSNSGHNPGTTRRVLNAKYMMRRNFPVPPRFVQ